jgi:hypothetical protein
MSDIHGSCLCGEVELSLPKDLPVAICRESQVYSPKRSELMEQIVSTAERPVVQCKSSHAPEVRERRGGE